ncbi:MAG: hypothetical protein KC496_20735, partial [Anaerolineae bacterium]|nr:hypothetical protein [Anaerolineae bacterium]
MAQAPAVHASQQAQSSTVSQSRIWVWVGLLIVMMASIFLFAPMMNHWRAMSDYEVHNGVLAQQFLDSPAEFFASTPHFLYHVLVGTTDALLPVSDIYWAGALVMTITYVALAALLYWQLLRVLNVPSWRWVLLTVVLTMTLLLVTPITFFTPDNLYLG